MKTCEIGANDRPGELIVQARLKMSEALPPISSV
jgi:hypothetical protein